MAAFGGPSFGSAPCPDAKRRRICAGTKDGWGPVAQDSLHNRAPQLLPQQGQPQSPQLQPPVTCQQSPRTVTTNSALFSSSSSRKRHLARQSSHSGTHAYDWEPTASSQPPPWRLIPGAAHTIVSSGNMGIGDPAASGYTAHDSNHSRRHMNPAGPSEQQQQQLIGQPPWWNQNAGGAPLLLPSCRTVSTAAGYCPAAAAPATPYSIPARTSGGVPMPTPAPTHTPPASGHEAPAAATTTTRSERFDRHFRRPFNPEQHPQQHPQQQHQHQHLQPPPQPWPLQQPPAPLAPTHNRNHAAHGGQPPAVGSLPPGVDNGREPPGQHAEGRGPLSHAVVTTTTADSPSSARPATTSPAQASAAPGLTRSPCPTGPWTWHDPGSPSLCPNALGQPWTTAARSQRPAPRDGDGAGRSPQPSPTYGWSYPAAEGAPGSGAEPTPMLPTSTSLWERPWHHILGTGGDSSELTPISEPHPAWLLQEARAHQKAHHQTKQQHYRQAAVRHNEYGGGYGGYDDGLVPPDTPPARCEAAQRTPRCGSSPSPSFSSAASPPWQDEQQPPGEGRTAGASAATASTATATTAGAANAAAHLSRGKGLAGCRANDPSGVAAAVHSGDLGPCRGAHNRPHPQHCQQQHPSPHPHRLVLHVLLHLSPTGVSVQQAQQQKQQQQQERQPEPHLQQGMAGASRCHPGSAEPAAGGTTAASAQAAGTAAVRAAADADAGSPRRPRARAVRLSPDSSAAACPALAPPLTVLATRLEAAAAAASAAAAAAASAAAVPHPMNVLSRPPGAPLPRVDPETYIQPDGSLLQGAVLQTACHVIRLAQLRNHLALQLPGGAAATSTGAGAGAAGSGGVDGVRPPSVGAGLGGSTAAGGKGAATGAPALQIESRRCVPVTAILKLLTEFIGAARALERAEAAMQLCRTVPRAASLDACGAGRVDADDVNGYCGPRSRAGRCHSAPAPAGGGWDPAAEQGGAVAAAAAAAAGTETPRGALRALRPLVLRARDSALLLLEAAERALA